MRARLGTTCVAGQRTALHGVCCAEGAINQPAQPAAAPSTSCCWRLRGACSGRAPCMGARAKCLQHLRKLVCTWLGRGCMQLHCSCCVRRCCCRTLHEHEVWRLRAGPLCTCRTGGCHELVLCASVMSVCLSGGGQAGPTECRHATMPPPVAVYGVFLLHRQLLGCWCWCRAECVQQCRRVCAAAAAAVCCVVQRRAWVLSDDPLAWPLLRFP